jgi:hypothetical protein
MIFIKNKYTNWYYSIVENARSRVLVEYSEKHHIIPKSLGGNNSIDNIVKLTAREHYICHLLLTKMTEGLNRHKMLHAAVAFKNWASSKHERLFVINSKIYEKIKKDRSDGIKYRFANDKKYAEESLKGIINLWQDPDHIEKMSIIRKQYWQDPDYRERMKSRKTTAKRVSVCGVIFNSCSEAGKVHNLTANCVSKRCLSKSKSFENWFYIV